MKQESQQEASQVNNILPLLGQIFTTTRGWNHEHESKRACRRYDRRVLTICPRLPLKSPTLSIAPIILTEDNFKVQDYPHSDAFLVIANVAGYTLPNILIEAYSSVVILFIKPFNSMGMEKRTIKPAGVPLFGFGIKKTT